MQVINKAFKQLQFSVNFTIFDPVKLWKAKEELNNYDDEELN